MNELTTVNGKLPATYVAAKKALAECSRIDECQEWANKAAALASYARQAKDESLRRMADRIQARATRRCGEILKQVPPGKGGRPQASDGEPAQIFTSSRSAAARDAGLSKIQKDNALATASIPEAEFERVVESEDPPPVYKLREMGRNGGTGIPLNPVDLSAIRKFARFCGSTDAASYAASVSDSALKKELSALIGEIDSWLDQFVTSL